MAINLFSRKPRRVVRVAEDDVRRIIPQLGNEITPHSVLLYFFDGKLPRQLEPYAFEIGQIKSVLANLAAKGLIEQVDRHVYRPLEINNSTGPTVHNNGDKNEQDTNGYHSDLSSAAEPRLEPSQEDVFRYAKNVLRRRRSATGQLEYTIAQLKELVHPDVPEEKVPDTIQYLLDNLGRLRRRAGLPSLHILPDTLPETNGYPHNGMTLSDSSELYPDADNRNYPKAGSATPGALTDTERKHKRQIDQVGLIIAKLRKSEIIIGSLYERGEVELGGQRKYGGAGGRKAKDNLQHDLYFLLAELTDYMPDNKPRFSHHSPRRVSMVLILSPDTHEAFRRFCQDSKIYPVAA